MACCIIGALIMAYVMTLKNRIKRFLGLSVPDPYSWEFGSERDAGGAIAGEASRQSLPWVSLRVAIVLGVAFMLGFLARQHWAHINAFVTGKHGQAGMSSSSQYVCRKSAGPAPY